MDTDIRQLSPEERRRLAKTRFEEYRRITRWLIVGFAFLIVLYWINDWAIDPVHAPDTVWLRLSAGAAALIGALATDKRFGVVDLCLFLYIVLLAIQVIITIILALLSNGFLVGMTSYLYFLLASVLLGQPYPLRYNIIGCTVLTVAPHLWGPFFDPEFPHKLYMASIWPAGLGCILFHWGASNLIMDRLYYRRKMETLSMEDSLTGLLNRRALLRMYLKARSLADREKQPLCLIMLDLDHFKGINDTYGHPVGDQVLISISEIMKKIFRASDTLARVGGEEFVSMMPDTDLDGAIAVGERLRAAVEKAQINIVHKRRMAAISLTVSLGVARAVPTENFEDLMKRADQALYRAKQGGRNRLEHIP